MLVDYNGTSVSLPDFFIVGAPRCGTSTLYSYLASHPRIFMPLEKEPMFFSCWHREPLMESQGSNTPMGWATSDPDEYIALFRPARAGQILGEASTWYLSDHEHVIANMQALYGDLLRDVKIIIALRNPADRAWSQYLQKKTERREDMDFESAIRPEVVSCRKKANLSLSFDYEGFSRYYAPVKTYLDRFDHVRVIIFEEFFQRVDENIFSLFDFLGVPPPEGRVNQRRVNVSGRPKGKVADVVLDLVFTPNLFKAFVKPFLPRRVRAPLKYRIKNLALMREPFDVELRRRFLEGSREDTARLERLLGRDLSLWYAGEKGSGQGARG